MKQADVERKKKEDLHIKVTFLLLHHTLPISYLLLLHESNRICFLSLPPPMPVAYFLL